MALLAAPSHPVGLGCHSRAGWLLWKRLSQERGTSSTVPTAQADVATIETCGPQITIAWNKIAAEHYIMARRENNVYNDN
jgi:hypothetical protein